MQACNESHGELMSKPSNNRKPDFIAEPSKNENRHRTFEDSIAALIEYKRLYGHVNVPRNYEGDSKLGKWVNQMRVAYSKSKLSQERISKLNQVGFQWSVSRGRKIPWQEHYDKLKEFWTKNGTCDVPSDRHEYYSMIKWCARQRDLFAQGKLKPDREMKLRSLGFVWDADRKISITPKVITNSRPSSSEGRVHLVRKHSGNHNSLPTDTCNQNKWPAKKYKNSKMDENRGTEHPELLTPPVSSTKRSSVKKRTKVLGGHSTSLRSKRKSPSIGAEIYQRDSDILEDTVTSQFTLNKLQTEAGDIQSTGEMLFQNSQVNNPHDALLRIVQSPPVGARIRRRYDVGGWFEGIIVDRHKKHYVVRYTEGDDEELSDEETKVAAVAYELNQLSGLPRPQVGEKLRKHYEEGWYEGKVTEQNEAESNVLFEDGEVECMTDDELQVCVAAYRIRHSPETCTDYQSLCKPLTQRPSVGAKARKRFKNNKWRSGEVIYQDEKVSHIRFDGATNEVEEMSDEELEKCVLAYEKHNYSFNEQPGAGAKVRKFLGKSRNSGEICSQAADDTFEKAAERTGEEKRTTPPIQSLSTPKKASSRRSLPSVTGPKSEGRDNIKNRNVTETIMRQEKACTSNMIADRESTESVRCAAGMQKDHVVKNESIPGEKANQKLIGKKLRRRFEGGWFNGTVVSIDGKYCITRFEDGEEEYLSDSEELRVAIMAHKRQRTSGNERPTEGTKIRKRFEEGWYEGVVIATLDEKKSYILYTDGDEEYMSDEEVSVCTLAYKMQHLTKKRPASIAAT